MKKIEIHDLCSRLSAREADLPEPVNDTRLRPSPERIKMLAMEKLSQQQQGGNPVPEKRRMTMKRFSVRVLVAVIAAGLVSITAFAAMGGLDYFRSIFGESAEMVGTQINMPMISASNENYQMAVAATLTDGYKTNLILSVEAVGKQELPDFKSDPGRFFEAKLPAETEMISCATTALDLFSQPQKKFFRMEISSIKSHRGMEIEVSMREELGEGTVALKPEKSLAIREVSIDPAQFADENYKVETVQLSPLGALVIGSEKQAKGALPNLVISVVMKDGSVEEIMPEWAFDQTVAGDQAVRGGGGVIVGGGQKAPLVIQTAGSRNPDGKVVTESFFSRVLNLDDFKAVMIGQTEYPL